MSANSSDDSGKKQTDSKMGEKTSRETCWEKNAYRMVNGSSGEGKGGVTEPKSARWASGMKQGRVPYTQGSLRALHVL